jgi:hypothetical protein
MVGIGGGYSTLSRGIEKGFQLRVLVQFENFSFTPPLQRGASALAWDWKPFKRFPISFAVPTPG